MIKIIVSITIFILSITIGHAQKKWSLQACIDYALENNITLKRADLNTNYSKEDLTIAKARLLPYVTASANQNVSIGNKYKRFYPSNNFGVSASYNIYNGGKNKLLLEQVKNSIDSNTANLEILQATISLQIANSYLDALFNKENIKIAKEQIVITTLQLNKMKELIDAGVNPRANLLDIQANLATNNEQLVASENALDLALLNLAQLIQVPPVNFDIQDVNINLDKAILTYTNSDAIYQKAIETRPEIKKALVDIENADLAIKIAKTDFKPIVNASYGLNTRYAYFLDGDGKFKNIVNQYFDNHSHNFGVSVSYILFDGKSRKTAVRKAKINKKIVEQGLLNEKLNLRKAVERAYLDTKISLKKYETSLSSLKAQEASFNIAQERYKLGAMNFFDFNIITSRLFNSKIAVINAKYNFVFKSKVLDFYNGTPIVID